MGVPEWVVTNVVAQNDCTLLLDFADGSRKIFSVRPLLEKEIYLPLRNPGFFMQAKVECGTVVWNSEVDIAPEYLYENGVAITALT